MKRLLFPLLASLCVFVSSLRAGIADQVTRTTVAGVDLIAYPTAVEDVVTFAGSLPAGDTFLPESNLAIATLVGGMLDKGTTTQDKFAIAQKLDAVGAGSGVSIALACGCTSSGQVGSHSQSALPHFMQK